MQHIKNGSIATQTDPIWHRLRVERVWSLILGGLWLVSISASIILSWREAHNASFFVLCLCLLALIKIFTIGVRNPSYWRRIGQRRDEALRGTQSSASPFQPVYDNKRLPVPTTFSLHVNKVFLRLDVIGVALVVLTWMVLTVLFFVYPGIDDAGWFFAVIVVSVLLASVVGNYTCRYFIYTRYHLQRIELTEEGIRACYMRQDRFLRWDEIRIFASYGAQWTTKSNQVRAYEVASEQMVVRWSQVPALNMLFSVQSDLHGQQDWNWLVGRLNTYVAERTGLSLLELGDSATKRPLSQTASPTYSSYPTTHTSAPSAEPNA
jgi:hypothetical protein